MTSPAWRPAYVALGSNLDDPASQVRAALAQMASLPRTRVMAHSGLWRSVPMGPQDQPQFVNAVAGLLTQLSARELLDGLQSIERGLGKRPPPYRWGPRSIDLDLLLLGGESLSEPGLTLPHPGLHSRNFVLYPLAEFAPALWIPGHGRVIDLKQQLGADGLEPLGP